MPLGRLRQPQMSLQSARGLHDEGYFQDRYMHHDALHGSMHSFLIWQDLLVAVGLAKSCTPRKHGSGATAEKL